MTYPPGPKPGDLTRVNGKSWPTRRNELPCDMFTNRLPVIRRYGMFRKIRDYQNERYDARPRKYQKEGEHESPKFSRC